MSLGRVRGHITCEGVCGGSSHACCLFLGSVSHRPLAREGMVLVGYLQVPYSTLETFGGFFPCDSRKLTYHKSCNFCFPVSYFIEARLKDLPNVQSREVSSRLTVQILVGWDSFADLHTGLWAETSSPVSQKPTSLSSENMFASAPVLESLFP